LFKKKHQRKVPLTRREQVAKRRKVAEAAKEAGVFTRSRTISSYRPGNNEQPSVSSERQVLWQSRHRRRRVLSHVITGIIIISLVLVLLWQLSVDVVVKTTSPINEDQRQEYLATLNDYYETRPFERLRFLTNRGDLAEHFLAEVPEVKAVDVVSGNQFMTSQLQLTFRQPVVQWSLSGQTYFVDESGIIFEENYFENPSVIVKDQSGIDAQVGQEVVNRRFLTFVGQAVALLKKDKLIVTEIILPPETVRQVDFALKNRSFAIRMTVDRNVVSQVDQAVSAVKYIDTHKKRVGQYLDVRVNQRVFYK